MGQFDLGLALQNRRALFRIRDRIGQGFAYQELSQPALGALHDDVDLVFLILQQSAHFIVFNALRPLVLVHAFA